jgi:hypothetical protein
LLLESQFESRNESAQNKYCGIWVTDAKHENVCVCLCAILCNHT